MVIQFLVILGWFFDRFSWGIHI